MSTTQAVGRVIVVGSANQDHIIRVSELPGAGETVLGTSLLLQPGGKGANQAVAAARLGAEVAFVGAVGDDVAGAQLARALQSERVLTAELAIVPGTHSGAAFVMVDGSGENSITVVPGANFALDAAAVSRAVLRLARQGSRPVVVVQAELTPEVMAAALRAGREAGARCVLNLAPYRPIDAEVLAHGDPLIVNESEASGILGHGVSDLERAAVAAQELLARVPSVIITLGARGAYWAEPGNAGHVAAGVPGEVVDTTGAGDALVGAVAAALAAGGSLREATEAGVAAGTFAVGAPGGQSSYPTAVELEALRARPTDERVRSDVR